MGGDVQVLEKTMPVDAPMAEDIYRFLARHFYINFGVLPLPAPPGTADTQSDDSLRVLIVGAGTAGLAALRALHQAGFRATAFEARDRPGGRVHTVPLANPRYAHL